MVAGRADADALDADALGIDVSVQKGLEMNADPVQLLRRRRPSRQVESPTDLIACSLCLRVRRGSEWVEAETVINELRSFALEAPPRLRAAVCEHCAEPILRRRARGGERVAA